MKAHTEVHAYKNMGYCVLCTTVGCRVHIWGHGPANRHGGGQMSDHNRIFWISRQAFIAARATLHSFFIASDLEHACSGSGARETSEKTYTKSSTTQGEIYFQFFRRASWIRLGSNDATDFAYACPPGLISRPTHRRCQNCTGNPTIEHNSFEHLKIQRCPELPFLTRSFTGTFKPAPQRTRRIM